MKKHMMLSVALLAVGVSAAGIDGALAASHDSKNDSAEIQSMMNAKVSAVQAAQAAEKNIGGKAAAVAFEGENGKPFYEVDVVTADGQKHSVAVDAASGEVTKMAANHEDEQSGQNGNENGQDEGGENEAGENAQQ